MSQAVRCGCVSVQMRGPSTVAHSCFPSQRSPRRSEDSSVLTNSFRRSGVWRRTRGAGTRPRASSSAHKSHRPCRGIARPPDGCTTRLSAAQFQHRRRAASKPAPENVLRVEELGRRISLDARNGGMVPLPGAGEHGSGCSQIQACRFAAAAPLPNRHSPPHEKTSGPTRCAFAGRPALPRQVCALFSEGILRSAL